MRGLVRHRRHDRDGGRARSDHHHFLARIIEIFGPELRMDHLAAKAASVEAGIVRLVVIVIARTEIEPVRTQRLAARERDRPARAVDFEIGRYDLASAAYMVANAAFVDDPVEVVEDRRTVGDRFLMRPRLEYEAQRVHVAVRAHAGIAEQIPRPAELVAPFEQGVGTLGAHHFQMRGHADARYASADDQHVVIGAVKIGAGGLGHAVLPC